MMSLGMHSMHGMHSLITQESWGHVCDVSGCWRLAGHQRAMWGSTCTACAVGPSSNFELLNLFAQWHLLASLGGAQVLIADM